LDGCWDIVVGVECGRRRRRVEEARSSLERAHSPSASRLSSISHHPTNLFFRNPSSSSLHLLPSVPEVSSQTSLLKSSTSLFDPTSLPHSSLLLCSPFFDMNIDVDKIADLFFGSESGNEYSTKKAFSLVSTFSQRLNRGDEGISEPG